VLADLRGGELPDRVVRAAVVPGAERSFDQDPMLAMRLLADIGLRALSPAINDPATAVDVLDAAEGLLRILATRELDVPYVADSNDVPRVRLVLPNWEDYLRTVVEDLLPAAAVSVMVLERFQRLLSDLLDLSPPALHDPLVLLSDQVHATLTARSNSGQTTSRTRP
jgi:uncharacterized membrane protein